MPLFNLFPTNYTGLALWRDFGPSARLVSARGSNMALADTAMYTVPTGKKAILIPSQGTNINKSGVYNPTAGAATVKQYVVPAAQAVGLNYQVNQITVAATSNNFLTVAPQIVMNAGDQMVLNPGVAGLNCWFSFVEADTADMPVASGYVSALGTSATLIYTVPAGKKALITELGYGAFNQSGGSATLTYWVVPSGGTADSTNLSGSSGAITTLTRGTSLPAMPFVLAAGDAIYASSSVAGAFNAWVFVAIEP